MTTGMLNLEIDGKPVQVPNGSTVMDATNKLGAYVPHFCYHKRLSIAANCRMCLVQVEKAPKPMPACATPATEGMKVWTHSEQAVKAQQGVMEFLLINHPLDCPICDQGGECQLQDLAVGYGGSASRYAEPKRVVLHKNIGPLVAAEEMSRCIHCTRCVRFGQEIAGVMELGMYGRGEHAEILTFVGRSVDSELSGNMIDLCPVGALTSKPFRYAARTWELSRRRSVAPHDALGSNVQVQSKNQTVLRVLPFENDDINECWLSDRDRFSYEGLNSEERLTRPLVRRNGVLEPVDWQAALRAAADGLARTVKQRGPDSLGALVSPQSTLEEMALAAQLIRGLGGDSIDFRLRQRDFSADGRSSGALWLGMPIAGIAQLDRVLFVGGFARKDHPLLTQRFRQAAKRGQQFSVLHVTDDDLLLPVHRRWTVRPSELATGLAAVVAAAAAAKGVAVPPTLGGIAPSDEARALADSIAGGSRTAIFLGTFAQNHPRFAEIHALAQALAEITGATLGFTLEAANSVGGYLAGAKPRSSRGANAREMLETPRRAYLLFGVDPELDCANPRAASAAVAGAEFVVSLASFRSEAHASAHVVLPVTPFTETSGTFVNCEGRAQSFSGVVQPLGEARPGWKVLRVLGNVLGLAGFDQDSSEEVRIAVLGGSGDLSARLSNRISGALQPPTPAIAQGLERIAEVPIYATDPLVRHAPSLQKTADARAPRVRARRSVLEGLGIADAQNVRVRQGGGEAVLGVVLDESVPLGCVRIATAVPATAGLGDAFAPVTVERA